jgi:putative transposase
VLAGDDRGPRRRHQGADDTREQNCWFHEITNVLNALPKSPRPGVQAVLAEIWKAEDKQHAPAAARAFAADYVAKWPKAVAKTTNDLDVLLGFYDYPAEHWIDLRTTNPIESTSATVRLRQRVTKRPGSRAGRVAIAFNLIESAQARWRAVNAPPWSPSSAQAPRSNRAPWSGDLMTGQGSINKSRDTPIRRP